MDIRGPDNLPERERERGIGTPFVDNKSTHTHSARRRLRAVRCVHLCAKLTGPFPSKSGAREGGREKELVRHRTAIAFHVIAVTRPTQAPRQYTQSLPSFPRLVHSPLLHPLSPSFLAQLMHQHKTMSQLGRAHRRAHAHSSQHAHWDTVRVRA
jgi:hypothetical protein